MKILVLNGSPKREKSDTLHLTRAFLEGMQEAAPQEVGERYEHVEQADFSHLRDLMICGFGFPNSRRNFEPAAAQFRLCFPGDHPILTVPESPMFNAPEAAVVTGPRLALVRQAGKQYAETGAVASALLAEISSPMIPEETYAAIVNGEMNAMSEKCGDCCFGRRYP